jgi:glycerol-3-phosphate acyltransferase PlsX
MSDEPGRDRAAEAVVVAVDAMGGDHAPRVVIEGALSAARDPDLRVLLVGPLSRLRDEVAAVAPAGAPVELVDAPDVVRMEEAALDAHRRTRRSSVRAAADLVASGRASALFTAGHSGAAVLAARTALGLMPGVERPALAVLLPHRTGRAVLLDVGANIRCRPEHLLGFARLGAAYAGAMLGCVRPRVGLLSIGEERGKGTDLVRAAYAHLAASELAFAGNVEARDLFAGVADVVVCDGFTGNIALKVGEGLAEAIGAMLDEVAARSVPDAAFEVGRAVGELRSRIDAAEHGAAPLLGVGGLVLVGHGRSSARAVERGIGMAARLSRMAIVERVGRAVAQPS